jgi:6-pyruvoyltetrahydropterin/6-carboxytetrahydropterin synthase
MYEVMIRSRFAAAHHLRGYAGQCEALHGHNWLVEVAVAGTDLDPVGMLLDFKLLKQRVKESLQQLDHTLLNDHESFKTQNPTSENLARWVYERVAAGLAPGLQVTSVRVWESEDAVATYRP